MIVERRAKGLPVPGNEHQARLELEKRNRRTKPAKPVVSRSLRADRLPDFREMAQQAAPGDLADLCLEMILANEDPRAVAERLLLRLLEIKNKPATKKIPCVPEPFANQRLADSWE